MKQYFTERYTLYRYRYAIGYTVIALIAGAVLLFAALRVPGGVSLAERQSAITSASIQPAQFSSWLVADLPYHLLQKVSLAVLGVTPFAIKLPSLVLSVMAGFMLVLLLRRWFKHSVSVIATMLVMCTAQYLYFSQLGIPAIMHIFWPITILLFANLSVQKHKLSRLWATLLIVAVALSIYTPLTLISLVAFVAGGLFHPHVRYLLRRTSVERYLLGGALGVAILAPLLYACVSVPGFTKTILIAPEGFSLDVMANAKLVLLQYFDVTGWSSAKTGLLTPVFGLSTLLIMLTGAYSLLRRHHSVHSYVIGTWIVLLLPVVLLNPRNTAITFVPMTMLLAAGVTYILWYWYRLFPLNPYARAFALIPIALLVGTICSTALSRYFYTMQYSEAFASQFTSDVTLVSRELDASSKPVTLITSPEDERFYQLLVASRDTSSYTVTSSAKPVFELEKSGRLVIALKGSEPAQKGMLPTEIVASKLSHDSDRLYLYKK